MERGSGSRLIVFILITVIVAVVSFGAGFALPYATGQAQLPTLGSTNGSDNGATQEPPSIPAGAGDIDAEFKSFWDTYKVIVDEYYYQPVDREALINGATQGMVKSLGDDFSNYLNPDENAVVKSSFEGNFEGVGMYIERRNDFPTVVAPIPNTPAERAGILARDIILEVDGRDVTSYQPDQVASIVRGPAGTKVRIKLLHAGEETPYEVELTRERIEVPSVTYEKQGDYALITLSVFNQKTTPELDTALGKAKDDNVKGIILDLRNNGGGLVTSALEMLGRFLPKDTVAFYESHNAEGTDDRPQEVISNGPQFLDIPLVVLVNGGSASASELTSGALQDYKRAVLIGEQTFGKGSEQHVYDWDDGSQARITFAHWLTPNKRDINPRKTPTPGPNDTPVPQPTLTPTAAAPQAPAAATATAQAAPLVPSQPDRGLTPDIVVVRTVQDFIDDKDPQLDRAIDYLTNGK